MLMMARDYWQEKVYAEPPLRDLGRCDMSVVFDWLKLNFPVRGTKIDWRRVQGEHMHWSIADDMRLAAMASREVGLRIRPGSVVEHVGDGLSPYGIRFTGDDAPTVVPALLEVPEHHYFVAEDRSWIVVVTIEGDLDVVDQLDF